MTTDAAAAELAEKARSASLAASAATQTIADLTLAQHAAVMDAVDEIRHTLSTVVIEQIDQRNDIKNLTTLTTEGVAQAKKTNGRVTTLELWRAELGGIAQGAGGSGRLLLYLFATAASSAAIITACITVAAHVVVK